MTECGEYVNPKRARTIAAILAVLLATKTEIEERAGLHFATVIKVMPQLHKAGQVHIGAWRPHPVHGPSMAVYHAGPGEDAEDALPRLTRKQISERFEKRIKGTEKYDQRKARHRSRHWVKKAAATPKSWAAALFVK
jgi:hypothetical protein